MRGGKEFNTQFVAALTLTLSPLKNGEREDAGREGYAGGGPKMRAVFRPVKAKAFDMA